MQKIVVLGAGGHAKSVIDTIEAQGKYEIAGIVDKSNQQVCYKKYKVIGSDSDLQDIYLSGVQRAFIAVGFLGKSNLREQLYDRLKNIGFGIPIIIDDTATVARNVTIGEGTYIGKGSVINTDAYIGKMCIVNTGVIIEHESRINDYTHVAVGAVLCGGVQVGRMSLIGANATVIQNLKIGNRCIVGAGTVITKNMGDNEMRYGSKCLNSPGD